MADSGNNSNGQNGSARWAGVVVTVVLAAGANKLIGKAVKATVDADTVVRVRLQQ